MAAPKSFTQILKLALVVVDIIILCSGIIMLIGGSVIQSQINNDKIAKTVNGYQTQSGSIICIIFGSIVILVSLFGLFAAIKDKHRFLLIYCAIMSVVFIIQFITGVVGLAIKNRPAFTDKVSALIEPTFTLERQSSLTDFYQTKYKCCGWFNYTDYTNQSSNTISPPLSCCKASTNCNRTNLDTEPQKYVFSNGCAIKLTQVFNRVVEVACGILVAMSILTLISIALSLALMRQISRDYQFT